MSNGAVVIIHDVVDHCTYRRNSGFEYATQLLFDTVVGDKYLNPDDTRLNSYPNIAAFCINASTRKYIANCFFALCMTWDVMPSEDIFKKYVDYINRIYENVEYGNILMNAKKINEISFTRRRKVLHSILEKNLCICGVGKIAQNVYRIFELNRIHSVSFLDLGIESESFVDDKKILNHFNLDDKNKIFVIAVPQDLRKEIKAKLDDFGIQKYIDWEDISVLF